MLFTLLGAYEVTLVPNPRYVYAAGKDLNSKRTDEMVVVTVDFAPYLAPGESVDAVRWVVGIQGQVGSADGMVHGASTILGTKVCQMIAAGEVGATYLPVCYATTSLEQVLALPLDGSGAMPITV